MWKTCLIAAHESKVEDRDRVTIENGVHSSGVRNHFLWSCKVLFVTDDVKRDRWQALHAHTHGVRAWHSGRHPHGFRWSQSQQDRRRSSHSGRSLETTRPKSLGFHFLNPWQVIHLFPILVLHCKKNIQQMPQEIHLQWSSKTSVQFCAIAAFWRNVTKFGTWVIRNYRFLLDFVYPVDGVFLLLV